MPFVEQNSFDRLLWSSDLNCVRGEDSLVRALWAGKPLLWQIYPQDDDAHLVKLDAWLALSPFGPEIKHLMTAWNTANTHDSQQWLDRALQPAAWAAWQAGAASWCRQLAGQMEIGRASCRERVCQYV